MAVILLCIHLCGLGESRRAMLIGAGLIFSLSFAFRYVAVFLVVTQRVSARLKYRSKIKEYIRFAVPVFGPVAIVMALVSASALLVVSFAAGQQLKFAEYRMDAVHGRAVANVQGQRFGE